MLMLEGDLPAFQFGRAIWCLVLQNRYENRSAAILTRIKAESLWHFPYFLFLLIYICKAFAAKFNTYRTAINNIAPTANKIIPDPAMNHILLD
jgi:hypothetical protein